MKNKFEILGANLNTLSSDDMKQTLGGGKSRYSTKQRFSPVIAALAATYVPETPPPGTVFVYGSYIPISTTPIPYS